MAQNLLNSFVPSGGPIAASGNPGALSPALIDFIGGLYSLDSGNIVRCPPSVTIRGIQNCPLVRPSSEAKISGRDRVKFIAGGSNQVVGLISRVVTAAGGNTSGYGVFLNCTGGNFQFLTSIAGTYVSTGTAGAAGSMRGVDTPVTPGTSYWLQLDTDQTTSSSTTLTATIFAADGTTVIRTWSWIDTAANVLQGRSAASGLFSLGNSGANTCGFLQFDTYVSTAATKVTLSGPSSGLTGAASTAFTVTLDGTTTADIVVTPASSNGGDTLTPTSRTLNNTTPSATFTLTPGSAGARNVSSTNNGGLANAGSPIAYTAGAASITGTEIAGRVHQRTVGGTAGAMAIAATYVGNVPASVEAQILQGATVIKAWTALTGATIASGNITGSLAAVPQGGGYTIMLRSKDSGGTVIASYAGTATVGVGKVFLVIGSSTPDKWFSQATGETANTLASKYDGSYAVFSAGVGAGAIAFVNAEIASDPGVPVMLLDFGVTNTTLFSWRSITYSSYVTAITAVTANGGALEAVICHVGSNDARNESIVSQATEETYYRQLVANLRTSTGLPTLKIFLMGCQRAPLEPSTSDQQWTWARACEMNVADDANVHLATVVIDLPLDTDNTHLSTGTGGGAAISARRASQRVAAAMRGATPAATGPKPVSATYSATTGKAVVTFSLGGGAKLVGRTAQAGITGFRASNDGFATLLAISATTVVTATTVELQLAAGLSGTVAIDYLAGTVPDVTNCLFNDVTAP